MWFNSPFQIRVHQCKSAANFSDQPHPAPGPPRVEAPWQLTLAKAGSFWTAGAGFLQINHPVRLCSWPSSSEEGRFRGPGNIAKLHAAKFRPNLRTLRGTNRVFAKDFEGEMSGFDTNGRKKTKNVRCSLRPGVRGLERSLRTGNRGPLARTIFQNNHPVRFAPGPPRRRAAFEDRWRGFQNEPPQGLRPLPLLSQGGEF